MLAEGGYPNPRPFWGAEDSLGSRWDALGVAAGVPQRSAPGGHWPIAPLLAPLAGTESIAEGSQHPSHRAPPRGWRTGHGPALYANLSTAIGERAGPGAAARL